jgi:hypothetical protein
MLIQATTEKNRVKRNEAFAQPEARSSATIAFIMYSYQKFKVQIKPELK